MEINRNLPQNRINLGSTEQKAKVNQQRVNISTAETSRKSSKPLTIAAIIAGLAVLAGAIKSHNNKAVKNASKNISDSVLEKAQAMRAEIRKIPGMFEVQKRMASNDPEIMGQDIDTFGNALKVIDWGVAGPSETLKIMREYAEKNNRPDLLEFFKKDDFVTEGILLYGEDEKAKQKLINYYVQESEKKGTVIEKHKFINGDIMVDLFKKCIARTEKDSKYSLIVIDDAEKFLKEENLGSAMGLWNTFSQNFWKQGISTITTAKNMESLNESAVRGGRIGYYVNVDAIAKDIMEKLPN